MATLDEQNKVEALRDLLGEQIPVDGSEEDTLFTDVKLLTYIKAGATMDHAALTGWRIKLAHFSNLVNVTDGAASRELGMHFEHAREMVKQYTNLAKSPSYGRSRVGKIQRTQ